MSPQPRAPLGYFWGDDTYGLDRAAEALGRRVGEEVGSPLERWRGVGESISASEIAERVATAPLFGGGTLAVVVDPAPLVRSKELRAALIATLELVANGNALAFLEPVDGSGRRLTSLDPLRDAVAAAGGEVREYRTPKEGQMAYWIEERAKERSIRLGKGASQELAKRIGAFVREGDVDRRRQGQLAVAELEKLGLYRPGGEVSVEDVRALVPEAVPGSTWALLDAVAMRRAPQAVELLDRLLDTTPEPVLLAQLHRRLRELIEVADHLAAGATPASLVRTLKLKPFRAEKLTEQARTWTLDELSGALEGLLDLDALVKGVGGVTASPTQRRLGFTLWVMDRVRRA